MVNYVQARADQIREKLKLHSYYRDTFGTPSGDAVLKHLCKIGHVGGTTFVPGDPHQTAHNEGMRRIVLSILKFTNKSPMQYASELERLNGPNTSE